MASPPPPPPAALQGRDPFSGDCDDRHSLSAVHSLYTPQLARTRPVFRGLRRDGNFRDPNMARSPRACKDETRFQGIATQPSWVTTKLSAIDLARTRPVFRGLRQSTHGGSEPSSRMWTCKDETRFQGIATQIHLCTSGLGFATLQGRDPFSGDCDQPIAGATAPAANRGLQGRDPFSGDCDNLHARSDADDGLAFLQGRDPFSGDCDDHLIRADLGRLLLLAGTRPVFRGLRLRPSG